ncbi:MULTISPECIES: DMT family transporter [unclassified Leptolyngbya]|uniref:DMT family transporter n=1 Tax=unclassified Leptolyngbya TaxID=2650499 RepID=UPI00321F771E
MNTFKGELAALGAALIWAIASFIYLKLGQRMSPIVLNSAKSTIAILMIGLTLLAMRLEPAFTWQSLSLLVVSGAIGIGLGDSAFFSSINTLGPRRALLMESLAPPLTALIAMAVLQERLGAIAWCGIFLTVTGVAWVVAEREADVGGDRSHVGRGVLMGLAAALCQAVGSVCSRAALADTTVSPIWSTLIRLVAGVLVLAIWLGAQPAPLKELRWLRSPRFLAVIVVTAFAGTFIGIWLQQIALKFTAAGIAQSLNSTSPLFVLPIALWAGERVSLRSVLGVIVALTGIWLLFRG